MSGLLRREWRHIIIFFELGHPVIVNIVFLYIHRAVLVHIVALPLMRGDTCCTLKVFHTAPLEQQAVKASGRGTTGHRVRPPNEVGSQEEEADWNWGAGQVWQSVWAFPARPLADAWPWPVGSGTRSSPGSLWGWGSWRILLVLQWTGTVSVWTFAPRPRAVRWWTVYGVCGWSCACGEDRDLPGLCWGKKGLNRSVAKLIILGWSKNRF